MHLVYLVAPADWANLIQTELTSTTTTLGQSGPGSNCNEENWSFTTECSLKSYPGYPFGEKAYLSEEDAADIF